MLLPLCILFVSSIAAQSTEERREMGIKSETILELFIGEGMDEPVPEKKEVYNERGDIIEIIEYEKTGEIKFWEQYEFDEVGNITGEIKLDKKGRIVERIITIYENDLKLEKQYFDSMDRMYKKKIYKYEYYENLPGNEPGDQIPE
jgi:hypothetical protein